MKKQPLRLGVNIDHVATLRNARGEAHPCPVRAAETARDAGAHGITAHLREDRRHIRDADLPGLKAVGLPLNLEMAATAEMQRIALSLKPNACCLVPEKRAELTTEGGLNVRMHEANLTDYIQPLKQAGIRVSLFIDADPKQILSAARIGADIVELHTGTYAHATDPLYLMGLQNAAEFARGHKLEVHAGHGLTFDNVGPVAAIPEVVELNIGHFLMGEALFSGLDAAVKRMLQLMKDARA